MFITLNKDEKECLKRGRKVIREEEVQITDKDKLVNLYFVKCTVSGEASNATLVGCFFEDCTIDLQLTDSKLSWVGFIRKSVIRKLLCQDCLMSKCSFEATHRKNCTLPKPDLRSWEDLKPIVPKTP
jgi:hypothetical protein